MQSVKKNILFLSVLIIIYFSSTNSYAEDVYLFNLIEKPTYSKAWENLFYKEKNVDQWLTSYSKTLNGPSSPRGTLEHKGILYQIGEVCEQHNCGENNFYVLFAPNTSQAWGIQIKNEKERFFGNPDNHKIEMLRSLNK